MVNAVLTTVVSILVFQYIIAAPSDVKLEDIAEVTQAEEKADTRAGTLLEETPEETAASQGQRQKRWYNYYGFPPVNPNFYNGDTYNAGGFRPQDPLAQIHRRLQDITNSLRQPQPPQFQPPLTQFPSSFPQFPSALPHFPAFVPVIYIPQVGCTCTPDDKTPRPTDNNQNTTDNPDVSNRWPEMEDERQNWGIVTNGTNAGGTNQDNNNEEDGDGSRPISFDPIRPIQPLVRPPPPVEHGSVEGGSSGNADTTTTTTPQPAPGFGAPPAQSSPADLQPPSSCDGAILRCCLLPQVTYDCFALQGCPDPSSYGYPCDSGVISRVIYRFQRFYNQRNG